MFAVDDLVLTVAPPGGLPEQLRRRVTLARLLMPTRAAVRLVAGADDLHYELERFVLVWQRVELVNRPLLPVQLGAALRAWHDLDIDEVEENVGALPNRDDPAPLRDDIRLLRHRGRINGLEERMLYEVVRRLDDGLCSRDGSDGILGRRRPVLLHGDLHRENILVGLGGTVLCDFDEVGRGCRDHDLGFLLDPARPLLDSEVGRREFELGYGGPLPTIGVARAVARYAHLRRTIAQLLLPDPGPRERFFNRVRVASWHQVHNDWRLDLHPVVVQSSLGQLSRGLRPRWAPPASSPGGSLAQSVELPADGASRGVRCGSTGSYGESE
ncbi:MAG: aminoglycoside phosphotransferase family protein [Microlunatus sp.]|nr:aminoglycoside phosphotransferase family protein [Microlunatus sp.]